MEARNGKKDPGAKGDTQATVPQTEAGDPLLAPLLQAIEQQHLTNVDRELIYEAFRFATHAHQGQLRKSGAPYITHCVDAAVLLARLYLRTPSMVAALLHDTVEDTSVTIEHIRERFGEEVAFLVDGVTKLSSLDFRSRAEFQAENFRKMILAMARDVRVVLIKLADRLTNMRTLEYLSPEAAERIAVETIDIYVPLAHRLGVYLIKTELEDLCFKTLHPDEYHRLVDSINIRRIDMQNSIEDIRQPIAGRLAKEGIQATIQGRLKSLHSIYNKMKRNNLSFSQLYDIIALRIITSAEQDCYRVMGIVHGLFPPIQERFKDYIATPKSNMYQSLHTTVVVPNGQVVEIQVRTEEMHRVAEMGIAAHWRYKEGRETIDELDRHVEWLRGMVDWQHDLKNPEEFMKIFKIDLYHDEVFAFTPKGDLVRLPLGSTPLDFAFHIHTDIGLSTVAAKVNSDVVPLDYRLKNGDTVEIILASEPSPKREWTGFAKTSKARSHLERWFIREEFRHSVDLGRELLEKNLNALPADDTLQDVAQSYGVHDADHLYAALARGDIHIQGVLRKIGQVTDAGRTRRKDGGLSGMIKKLVVRKKGVRIKSDDNLMIELASCCQPIPGDHVIGFIEKGKGLLVHRTECRAIVSLLDDLDSRVEVDWDISTGQLFNTTLAVHGSDRKNLLVDVITLLSRLDVNIVKAQINTEKGAAHDRFEVSVKNLNQLQKAMKQLRRLKGVARVSR